SRRNTKRADLESSTRSTCLTAIGASIYYMSGTVDGVSIHLYSRPEKEFNLSLDLNIESGHFS
ncbi:MAG: hypothetical protein KUG80_02680, partial [Gammaproteobacteria bacterium]|nr:hypothetical protein [Gammaproteobacteria bacterium]